MRYYPINLDIRGKRCVVIGGGRVAERKVLHLRDAGALITVIAPALTPVLEQMSEEGFITAERREYKSGDLDGATLAFIATDEPSVNKEAVAEAQEAGILINVGDVPTHCDFTVPALVSRGDVLITVSTGGASPALSAHLRRAIENEVGEEYGPLAEVLRALREPVLERVPESDKRKELFERLVESSLRKCLANRDVAGADAILSQILGPGYSLEGLGVKL